MTNPTPEMVSEVSLKLYNLWRNARPTHPSYDVWDEMARFVLAREAQAHQAGLMKAAEICEANETKWSKPAVSDGAMFCKEAILAAAQGGCHE